MESFPLQSRALRAPAAGGMRARLIKTGRAWRDNAMKSFESFSSGFRLMQLLSAGAEPSEELTPPLFASPGRSWGQG